MHSICQLVLDKEILFQNFTVENIKGGLKNSVRRCGKISMLSKPLVSCEIKLSLCSNLQKMASEILLFNKAVDEVKASGFNLESQFFKVGGDILVLPHQEYESNTSVQRPL